MFEELSQRFEDAVRGLKGEASISEGNIDAALKDVRRALLEADVSLPVVKEFVAEAAGGFPPHPLVGTIRRISKVLGC